MILLVLLAVGLLSLSTVALRSSGRAGDLLRAQANARLSLQLAIGRLQLLTGPDTRVTAPADAVAGGDGPRQLTGVWRSWEGNDHDKSSGRPLAPNYGSKLDSGDLEIDSSSSGRFLGWLVSGTEMDSGASDPPSISSSSSTVSLLATGTLGSGTNAEVHLPATLTDDGAYAWWIEGENTKVQLKPTTSPSNNFEASDQMLVSPGPSGSEFGIDDTSKADRAPTRETLDFLASGAGTGNEPSNYFHDLTVNAKGLLTNTANGGWRRDLSLFSENYARVPNGFSSFTLSPGEIVKAGKSHQSGRSVNLMYPWGDARNVFPDSVSWSALADFSTQYQDIKSSGKEVPEYLEVTNDAHADWINKVQRIPVLARVHLVISLGAKPDGNTGKYFPAIVVNPVITMWNPYSVALNLSTYPNYYFSLNDAVCPFNFTFKVGTGTKTSNLVNITGAKGNTSNISADIRASAPAIWLPGEVRVFSATGNAVEDKQNNPTLPFNAGYRPGSGIRYAIPGFTSQSATTTFSLTDASISSYFGGPNVKGTGFYFTHDRWSRESLPRTTNVQCMLDLEDAKRMLGDRLAINRDPNPPTLSSLARLAEPKVAVISSLRFARDTNETMNNILVNGVHEMNPTVGYMVNGNDATAATALKGRFDVFPYNVEFFAVNSLGDPGMPSGITDELEGYLGSGFSSNDGLSNLVALEVPTRPLRSIGDLQHFNVNACVVNGPYTMNALGNSRASAFIESDKIRISEGGGEVGHDHSYAINHVMLDDWFVSSIAPETNAWSSRASRSVKQVYEDHLSGEEALPNHYYKPLQSTDDSDAASILSDRDSWQKIAAELEVEGMFNINSTSELAWEMLLKRNFAEDDGGVLVLGDSTPGGRGSATLEKSDGSAFPRSTLNSNTSSGGIPSLVQQLSFTDTQIEALAREIVVEIKERGPFLSLSEFFNRQLSSDAELAKAGAVESALLRLSNGSSGENPYQDIQADFGNTSSTTDVLGNPLRYPFPEAAAGNPAYGFPGWTRQADVLRPISGILSARDDTFTIRAYGDARDAAGNILSRAWCEAVVQRTAEYVDNSDGTGDDKYTLPGESTLQSEANKRFGRRYEIVQFRWLNSDEV